MDSLVFLILAHFVDIFHVAFNTMYSYRSAVATYDTSIECRRNLTHFGGDKKPIG